MEKILAYIGVGVLASIVIIGLALLWSVITWWAWNLVMPFLFHLPQINLLQAFAINLLTALVKGYSPYKK